MDTKAAVKECEATGLPLPEDLAGFQNVVVGQVQDGDLLIRPDGLYEWAKGIIRDPIESDGTTGSTFKYRVYRRIACPKAGDTDTSWKTTRDECMASIPLPSATKALTFDEGKDPLAQLPWAAMRELSRVQAYGHKKYKDFNNYRKGMEIMRNLSCSVRHIVDFIEGKNTDHESGLNPLSHALARISFVLQNLHDGVAIDDRYKKPTS